MTMMQAPCSVNHSVSPSVKLSVAPLCGADAIPQELQGDHDEKEAAPEVLEDTEEIVIDGEEKKEEVEMRKPRIGVRPVAPTKAEMEAHYPLHLEYRSWCAHCRAGKARLAPHLCEPADREKLGITVSCNYASMGSEEKDENIQPSLIIFDDDKEAFWAIGVKSKTLTDPWLSTSRIFWTRK